MKNPRISFLIPLYNTEAYIAKCLQSILDTNLNGEEYEVVVWNDGSSDGSMDIVERYAQEYPQIRYFSESNRGIAFARNNLIRKAKGVYLWFVDSDDIVHSALVKYILSYAENNNLDIEVFNYKLEESDGKIYPGKAYDCNSIKSGIDFCKNNEILLTLWRLLYKRDFVIQNELFFPENFKTNEDYYFNYHAFSKAKRVSGIFDVGYTYYQRSTSIVHQKPDQVIRDGIFLMEFFLNNKVVNYPNDFLTLISYRTLKGTNQQLRFLSKEHYDNLNYSIIVKRALRNYKMNISFKGLYVFVMRFYPLFFFKSKEGARAILKLLGINK